MFRNYCCACEPNYTNMKVVGTLLTVVSFLAVIFCELNERKIRRLEKLKRERDGHEGPHDAS